MQVRPSQARCAAQVACHELADHSVEQHDDVVISEFVDRSGFHADVSGLGLVADPDPVVECEPGEYSLGSVTRDGCGALLDDVDGRRQAVVELTGPQRIEECSRITEWPV